MYISNVLPFIFHDATSFDVSQNNELKVNAIVVTELLEQRLC